MKNRFVAQLLLGSNVGDRQFYLDNALSFLSEHFTLLNSSSIYETVSWGDRIQQPYLNMAVEIVVDISPHELHKITRQIEQQLGRVDKGNYLPRTIDIDIIFFGNEIIDSQKLTIPHPRLQNRRFVLKPLNDLNPSYIHPILKRSVEDLLKNCADNLAVELFDPLNKLNNAI